MNRKNRNPIDRANALIIFLTFFFFAAALFIKASWHDLLLEAAVFLVSVKLIIATYQLRVDLRDIRELLQKRERED